MTNSKKVEMEYLIPLVPKGDLSETRTDGYNLSTTKITSDFRKCRSPTSNFSNSLTCRDHIDFECELLCKQCLIPICPECIIGLHKGHELEKLFIRMKVRKENLLDDIDIINKILLPTHMKMLAETKVNARRITKATQTLSVQLKNKMRKLAPSKRKQVKREVFYAFHVDQKEIVSAIKSQEYMLERRIMRLQEIIQTICQLLQANLTDACLITCPIQELESIKILPEIREYSLPYLAQCKMTLETPGILTPSFVLKTKPSHMITNLYTTVQNYENTCTKLVLKPMRIAKFRVNLNQPREIRCLNAFTAIVSGVDEEIEIVNILGPLNKIRIKDFKIKISRINCPKIAVKITSDKTFVIYSNTASREIKQISVDGLTSNRIFITEWFPFGLCNSKSGNILVCLNLKYFYDGDDQHGKIVKYNQSGNILQEIRFDQGKALFKRPISVCENPVNEDIVVSDWAKAEVIVVNKEGKLRFLYTGKITFRRRAFWPKQVACDTLGNVLIADEQNAVCILSKDGDFLKLFKDHFNMPVGICFDGVDSMWIIEESQKCKVYKYLE